MNRKDTRRQVLSNFEALRSYVNNSHAADHKQSLVQIIFAPHENIEILIAELLEINGVSDFPSFIRLHKELVNYLMQVDHYLKGQSQFDIADIKLLESHHGTHAKLESLTREFADLHLRTTKLDEAKRFLDAMLPTIYHRLFDNPSCPQEVYDRGKRLLTDHTIRSSAAGQARNLPVKVFASSSPSSCFLEIGEISSPYTIEAMERGVRIYLQLMLGSVLIEKELTTMGQRIVILTQHLTKITPLCEEETQELVLFQHNNHPIYNTGVYAGYAHTLVARLLVKIAQEISSLGANVSLNINME